jgi:hypothetical protein
MMKPADVPKDCIADARFIVGRVTLAEIPDNQAFTEASFVARVNEIGLLTSMQPGWVLIALPLEALDLPSEPVTPGKIVALSGKSHGKDVLLCKKAQVLSAVLPAPKEKPQGGPMGLPSMGAKDKPAGPSGVLLQIPADTAEKVARAQRDGRIRISATDDPNLPPVAVQEPGSTVEIIYGIKRAEKKGER